jgi:hypothetical protein
MLPHQGVFQEISTEKNTATLWVMAGGLVLSCDGTFTDWLGYKHEDIHSKLVPDLVVQREELEGLLSRVKTEVVVDPNTRRVGGGCRPALQRDTYWLLLEEVKAQVQPFGMPAGMRPHGRPM